MILKLQSGFKIAISPIFPWESRKQPILQIRSSKAFNPDHVTTRLSLQLLDNLLKRWKCESLLDVGCGCGILTLAAVRLGVPFAVGFDISAKAVKNSMENAMYNGLDSHPLWFIGTLAAVKYQFDCITANLPYHVIWQIRRDLPLLLRPRGHLILSGFQDVDWSTLWDEFSALGFSCHESLSGDRSFYGSPPSGSFTWVAADLVLDEAKDRLIEEGR